MVQCRYRTEGGAHYGKALDNLFSLMDWDRECRYKILGRIAASERGLILVFEMEEAIMFAPRKEEYINPTTGETKKRQVKFYPDAYKNRIGRSYSDYAQYRQMNLFEDFNDYDGEKSESVHEAAEDQHLEENLEQYELAVQEAPSLMVHNNPEENDDSGSIQ